MSDYIAELRRELVDAAERERRRSAPRRTLARSRRPLALGLATAAVIVAAVVGLAMLGRITPEPVTTAPRVVTTIPLGFIPQGVAVGAGSVWVTDPLEGRLLRFDPATRRVIATVRVGTAATWVSASDDAVWVVAAVDQDAHEYRLVRVDPARNRVVARIGSFGWAGATLAAAPEALWLQRDKQAPGPLRRVDPATNRIGAEFGESWLAAMAASGDRLWTLTQDGVLEWRDADTGSSLGRRPGFAQRPPGGPWKNTIAPDADGAYVATGANGSVARVSSDGRVEWTVAVGANGPIAVAGGSLWVTVHDGSGRNAELVRLDPADGHVSGRIPVGARLPSGLVTVGDDLWAVLSDGTAIVVR